jgi:hypothetical protein
MGRYDAGAMPGGARLVEFIATGISADRARWAFHRAGLRGWSTPASSQQPDSDTASIRGSRFFVLRGHRMGWHPVKDRQAPRRVRPRSADRTGAGKRKQDARAMATEFVPYSSGAPWGQKASRPRSRLLDAKDAACRDRRPAAFAAARRLCAAHAAFPLRPAHLRRQHDPPRGPPGMRHRMFGVRRSPEVRLFSPSPRRLPAPQLRNAATPSPVSRRAPGPAGRSPS